MTTSSHPHALAARRAIAAWLGVLFVLVMALITLGGFVRLSGSGLSIPDWPIIHIGESRSLLPPMTDAGWLAVRERFDADQHILREKVAAGVVGIGSLGRDPADMREFKRMFFIEWTHRFVAAILGLVALGCLTTAWRHRHLRRDLGWKLSCIVGLIIFQAILGGFLVKSGTSTHWLFLHLGTAAIILASIVWTLLRAVSGVPPVPTAIQAERRRLRRLTTVTITVVLVQIILGALVAGSRSSGVMGQEAGSFSTSWPLMYGHFIPPDLWNSQNSLTWNLLDNPTLHQWLHRWFAAIVLIYLGLVFWRARPLALGDRTRFALQATATLIGVQVVLGLANVFLEVPVVVALAHLVVANLIVATLTMTLHDVRYELPEAGTHPISAPDQWAAV